VYLVAGKGVPDATVEAALRAIWDGTDTLRPMHPLFREWTRERVASHEVTLPYHPAAVRFFKERGVWKPEMEQAQQKLLSLNP
jgi:TRAP-type uncharacterized transport system substrate-binding protein